MIRVARTYVRYDSVRRGPTLRPAISYRAYCASPAPRARDSGAVKARASPAPSVLQPFPAGGLETTEGSRNPACGERRRGRDLNPRRTKPPETVFEACTTFDLSALLTASGGVATGMRASLRASRDDAVALDPRS